MIEKYSPTPIYVWADGSWCEPDDLHEMLSFKSDDYRVMWIDESDEPEEIDAKALKFVSPIDSIFEVFEE